MGKYDKLSKEELLEMIEKQDTELELKKYGLAWDKEREPEKVVVDCQNNLPILERIANKEIHTNDEADNIMIEGDNYHALKVLNYTHKEKIDVIYIDPPYNTGTQDWKYNDKYVDKEDGYRHSKWLNFMQKRLDLAKNLLKDTGVIFISIDDNEQANLKLLCDKIFGPDNFIANISREAIKGGSQSKHIRNCNDYVLIYAKKFDELSFSGYTQDGIKLNLKDKKGNYAKGRELNKWGAGSRREDAPSMWYSIKGPNNEEVYPIRNDGSEGRWRLGKKRLTKMVEEGDVIFEKRKDETFIAYEKIRDNSSKVKQFTTLFKDKYINAKGAESLKKIFNTMMSVFDYAKPVELIYDLLVLADPEEDAIILDFMAGSGTTGQAVLEYNKRDEGKRKFILCTNNENEIAEKICYPRIEKVINGYNFNGKERKELFSKKISYKELEKNSEAIFEEVNKIIEKESNNYDKFEKTINEKYLEVYGVKEYSDKKEGLGGNLQYLKTGFVDNTKNEEQIRWNLTNKCTDMLCVRENIFNLKKEGHDYKIFASNRSDKYLCIYYNLADNSFNDFLKEVKGLKGHKSIYMFSLNDKLDKSLFKDIDDCEFEPIPQNILDLYKRIRKKHITEENDKDE
ncbi:MAG: site-specific DNA-methyltransferase [Alphaproteobacteria bacterium]|nr:site-specific DNA-methyltransferase [Alphaproteobacteria bacterium]